MPSNFWWLAPVVPIVGWFVVRYFHNERETRKEVRSQIESAISLVEQIQTNCYKYYGKAGNDENIVEIAQQIRCSLKQAGIRASNLNIALPNCGLMARFIKFRQSASIRIDDVSRHAMPGNDPLYDEISNTGGLFVSCLNNAFRDRFQR